MGRFASLNPGSQEERETFWREYEPTVRELLQEVNEDVFDGKLAVVDDSTEDGHLARLLSIENALSAPFVALDRGWRGESILIGVAHGEMKLRVVVLGSWGGYLSWTASPDDLERAIIAAVRVALGIDMRTKLR